MWRHPTMQKNKLFFGPGGGAEKEIGWYDVAPTDDAKDDRLLGAWARAEKIFQWHGDTFDIPRTSRHLAFSSLCSNQAFRYGTKVYGFQFHLEVEERMI